MTSQDQNTDGKQRKSTGYKNLLVGQKAIELVKGIYKLTKPFPKDEKSGLVSQMRPTLEQQGL